MNFLFCNAWKHAQIIKDFKETLSGQGKIVSTSKLSDYPSLYLSDQHYVINKEVRSEEYIEKILDICKKESIDAIFTIVDLETEVLSENKTRFEDIGVQLICSDTKTTEICRDKYLMFNFMRTHGIKTMTTYNSVFEFHEAYMKKEVDFPVFVKPNFGHGSNGAQVVHDQERLKKLDNQYERLIIQEYIQGVDIDVDVYADMMTNEIVSIYSKQKLKLPAKEEAVTCSFHDDKLLGIVKEIATSLDFIGPLNFDFILKDNEYYLVEINPRFGAGYIHTHESGVNFIEMMLNNLNHKVNDKIYWNYEPDTVMLKYEVPLVLNKIDLKI